MLQALLPFLSASVVDRISALFPSILAILRSPFAILRNRAAKTFAVACEVMPASGMLFMIENILPLLADSLSESNRMGAIEAIHCEYIGIIFS